MCVFGLGVAWSVHKCAGERIALVPVWMGPFGRTPALTLAPSTAQQQEVHMQRPSSPAAVGSLRELWQGSLKAHQSLGVKFGSGGFTTV